jgi:hypothetical protein
MVHLSQSLTCRSRFLAAGHVILLLGVFSIGLSHHAGAQTKPVPAKPLPVASKPSADYQQAVQLRQSAAAFARKGDIKSAYQASLLGWQGIRKEKDQQAKELAAKLLRDLEQYGEQLETPKIQRVLVKPIRYE